MKTTTRTPTPNSIFEIGDVLAAPDFGSFALSPDGRFLVLSRIEYVRPTAMRRSRVEVLALDEAEAGKPAPETTVFTGDCDGWSPEFHDDSDAILFLSDYSGEARPWIAATRNAVPAAVHCVMRMAVAPKWRPRDPAHGFAILSFATRAEQGYPDPVIWETVPEAGFRHLYVVEDPNAPAAVDGTGLRKLTAGPEDVYDFAWSPDGTHLAVLVSPSFEMEQHADNELRILRASDGEVVRKIAMPRGLNAFLSFSPAGTHLAFIAHGAGARVGKPDLYVLRLSDGKTQLVSENVPGWVSRYDWMPGGGAIWFPAAEGVRTALYHSALDGETFTAPRLVHRPDGFLAGLTIARQAPRAVLRLEGPRTPPVLVLADLDVNGPGTLGNLRPITARSPRRDARIPGDADVLEVKAPDGKPVDAVVLRARKPTGARPVCVWLHGGPNEFCALSYQPWWQLFVARGYTVLGPNFRGSGSYAEERVRWNVADLGGGDADDVIACLDALEGRDDVDLSRVVLFGWSYGAHLAFHVARKIAARGSSRKLRASSLRRIVAGGGVYDWLSHYGQAELRFPWRDYLGGSPLLDAREADARSPVRFVRELAGPMAKCKFLLLAGQNDGRASPMQSRTMHRALREAGLDSTHILYPAEAHILVEPEHIRDLLDRASLPLV